MQIGEYKVKRNIKLAQVVVDAAAVIALAVMGIFIYTFSSALIGMNTSIENNASSVLENSAGLPYAHWYMFFIEIAIAVVVLVLSLVLTFKSRKMPKRYNIPKENIQKYYDAIVTAICCIRLLIFMALCEIVCIHYEFMVYQGDIMSLVNVQIICEILLTLILIRFTVIRIKALEINKTDEKSHTIIEN